jgi:hypothetical protein
MPILRAQGNPAAGAMHRDTTRVASSSDLVSVDAPAESRRRPSGARGGVLPRRSYRTLRLKHAAVVRMVAMIMVPRLASIILPHDERSSRQTVVAGVGVQPRSVRPAPDLPS